MQLLEWVKAGFRCGCHSYDDVLADRQMVEYNEASLFLSPPTLIQMAVGY